MPSLRSATDVPRLVYVLLTFVFCLSLLDGKGSAQERSAGDDFKRVAEQGHASKHQLVKSRSELRVSRLLAKMTLAEKLGQLVQYDDSNTGLAADGLDPIVPANPEARNSVSASGNSTVNTGSNPGQGVSVNGNLPYNFILADGASSTLVQSTNADVSVFETVEEVQISTSAVSAQYGVGGIIL